MAPVAWQMLFALLQSLPAIEQSSRHAPEKHVPLTEFVPQV
jgi:hypothetical protein